MIRFVILLLVLSFSGCGDDNKPFHQTSIDPLGTNSPSDTAPLIDELSMASYRSSGILWKPVSEKDGKLTILLAPSWGTPSVKILNMRRQVLDVGKFTGKSNPNRATYRFRYPGGRLPNPCILQIGNKLFQVSNPGRRHE